MIGVATVWAVSAAWFSANRIIAVTSELALYWLSFIAVLVGWALHLDNRRAFTGSVQILATPWAGAVALLVVLSAWLLSDGAFFRWKLRAVPPEAWSQMVLDLKSIAIPYPEGDTVPSRKVPPKSVQRLGLGHDFGVMNAWIVDAPGYPGVKAEVLFGYKSRAWGLWVGPEISLLGFCPGCRHVLVASNAFFFVGPRG
jgi:hypothetical protein